MNAARSQSVCKLWVRNSRQVPAKFSNFRNARKIKAKLLWVCREEAASDCSCDIVAKALAIYRLEKPRNPGSSRKEAKGKIHFANYSHFFFAYCSPIFCLWVLCLWSSDFLCGRRSQKNPTNHFCSGMAASPLAATVGHCDFAMRFLCH